MGGISKGALVQFAASEEDSQLGRQHPVSWLWVLPSVEFLSVKGMSKITIMMIPLCPETPTVHCPQTFWNSF